MKLERAANETRLPLPLPRGTPLKSLGVEVEEKLGLLWAIEDDDIIAARDMALNCSLAFSIQFLAPMIVLVGAPEFDRRLLRMSSRKWAQRFWGLSGKSVEYLSILIGRIISEGLGR